VSCAVPVTGPNSFSTSVTTEADGTVCVGGLPFGTYSVTETEAPPGYSIDDTTAHDVVVNAAATCAAVTRRRSLLRTRH
jgi:uncharacterized surface anchored protein